MNAALRTYLAKIGQKGGKKSRRTLTSEQARSMVRIRMARKAFRRFHTRCFWSYDPDLKIGAKDVAWVGQMLMRQGDREAWEIGAKLCR